MEISKVKKVDSNDYNKKNRNDEEKTSIDKLKKVYIIGFFVISLLGTFLHFAYDISGGNILVSLISAVNESVWEHIKIAVVPVYLYGIIEYLVLVRNKKNNSSHSNSYNLFFLIVLRAAIITFIIPVIYYIYTAILKRHIFMIDIFIFYIAIFIAQIVSYNFVKRKYSKISEKISKQIAIIIILLFALFTFVTPNFEIFRDETTNTYGIFRNKY